METSIDVLGSTWWGVLSYELKRKLQDNPYSDVRNWLFSRRALASVPAVRVTTSLAVVAQYDNRTVDGRLTSNTVPKRHILDRIIPFHLTSLYFNETAIPLLTYMTQHLSLVDTLPVLETVCYYKCWPHVNSPLTVGRYTSEDELGFWLVKQKTQFDKPR